MSRWSDGFGGDEIEPTQVGRWSDLFEGPKPAKPKPQAGEASSTFMSRAVDMMKGKHDPAYKDVPALDYGGSLPFVARTAVAKLGGADDAAYGDVMQKALGDKFVRRFKDANGYDLIEWTDNGQKRLGYVNKPGLDLEDVSRGLFGAVPYLATGAGIASKLKDTPVLLRGLAQVGTGASTSMLGDLASSAAGSDQGIDVGKAALAGALGGAAEVLPSKALMAAGGGLLGSTLAEPDPQGGASGTLQSAAVGGAAGYAAAALARRFLMVQPGTFARDGKLTAAGEEAATKAGVDPKAVAGELANEFDRQMVARSDNVANLSSIVSRFKPTAGDNNPLNALTGAEAKSFGIPIFKGEISGDKGQLLREQHIRSGNYGPSGASIVKAGDAEQRVAIRNAAIGDEGLARQIAPHVPANEYAKKDLGEKLQGNLSRGRKTAEAEASDAWEAVPLMRATPEALELLPDHLNRQLGHLPVQPGSQSEAMAKALSLFMGGKAPAKAADWMTADPTANVDLMRRHLLALKNGAGNATDRAAAGALYRGVTDWIDDAAQKKLLGGDLLGAAKLTTARGLTERLHRSFDGERGSAAARILSKIADGADSGESVINSLFVGGSTSQIKDGAPTTVRQLRKTFEQYLPKAEAKEAWDEVRLAYYLKMVQGRDGELLEPKALASSIQNTIGTQKTLASALMTPQEISRLLSYASLLEKIGAKNPNTSWSGVSAAGYLKDAFNAILGSLGGNTVIGKMLITGATKPIQAVRGHVLARDAVSQELPKQTIPSLGGYGSAAAPSINPLMQYD